MDQPLNRYVLEDLLTQLIKSHSALSNGSALTLVIEPVDDVTVRAIMRKDSNYKLNQATILSGVESLITYSALTKRIQISSVGKPFSDDDDYYELPVSQYFIRGNIHLFTNFIILGGYSIMCI